jgi:predicted dehydrogenase
MQTQTSGGSRRNFLKAAAIGLTAPYFIRNLRAAPPSETVRHASFGASGMAGADLSAIASHPNVKLICVCDVDESHSAALLKSRNDSNLKSYVDYRELLDKEGKNLDSVNVSTPDHMHAPIAMAALQLGLAVYGQKPLTHDVYESRRLTEVAREKKLVTQMGIQVHSSSEYKTAVKLVHDGAIGGVKEVHTWSDKKWGDESPKPDRKDEPPKGFHWDLWLGVMAERPFIGDGYYHPGNWRKRIDFGTGTFGDMGCHIYDPVFEALGVTAPLSVRSSGEKPGRDNWANNAVVEYVFPGTKYTADKTVKVTWYDGDRKPPKEIAGLVGNRTLPGQGSLLIGDKGIMIIPHVAMPILLPDEQYKDFKLPVVEGKNHWHEFVEAVRGNGQTSAPFDYSGPLTEAVLLGGVASRFPNTKLEWDAPALKFSNVPEANQYIRREYRRGRECPGLSDV